MEHWACPRPNWTHGVSRRGKEIDGFCAVFCVVAVPASLIRCVVNIVIGQLPLVHSRLYSSTPWEYKQIRRLIGDGKLAARVKGTEERKNEGDMECPICFFYYSAVNKTKCCQACICTECYLQVRNPKDPSTDCPFCNQKLAVTMMSPLSKDDIAAREAEEQKTIEAKIRANSVDTDMTANSDATTTKSPPPTLNSLSQPPNNPGFGASLAQNDRVAMMRKRSTSGSSADPGDSEFSSSAVGMTAEERRALEAEMKAQHQHPLARRMEQEEEERRFRNQQEYMSSPQYQQRVAEQERMRHMQARRLLLHASGAGRSSRRGGGGASRDWNRIVEAFESGSAGNAVQSLDDLVVLEAAIMLSSMDPQNQQQQNDGNDSPAEGGASASRRGGEGENSDDFAAHHARAGFPLARARVGGDQGDSLLSRSSAGGRSTRRQQQQPVPQPWMMQALMSEEEQIAMAIAASLRDAPTNNSDDNDNNNNDEEGQGDNENGADETTDDASNDNDAGTDPEPLGEEEVVATSAEAESPVEMASPSATEELTESPQEASPLTAAEEVNNTASGAELESSVPESLMDENENNTGNSQNAAVAESGSTVESGEPTPTESADTVVEGAVPGDAAATAEDAA